MPIYSYHCEDCKEPFDVFVRSMSSRVEAVCPACGGYHVEKSDCAKHGWHGRRRFIVEFVGVCLRAKWLRLAAPVTRAVTQD